jgi:hypothetical protein
MRIFLLYPQLMRNWAAKAPRSYLIGFQNLAAQIVRYGLCQPLRFAEIASSNLTLLAYSGI